MVVEDSVKYGVANAKIYHGLSLLILVFAILQLASGFFLVSIAQYSVDSGFDTLVSTCRDNYATWFVRDCHMLGANVLTLLSYPHLAKSLATSQQSPTRAGLWVGAAALLLLLLAACFSGYVLVAAQMSI